MTMVKKNTTNEDKEYAAKVILIAKEALKQIVSKRLLPWPEVYEKEFWAVCYRDKAEDILRKKVKPKEAPRLITERFLKDTEEILGGVHDTVDEFVGDTKSHFDDMHETISCLTQKVQDRSEVLEDLNRLAQYNETIRKKAESTEKKLLEQSRTIEKLKERLRLDPLTGLLNRHALITDLAREISRARRYNYPLSLMMIDVDDFKDINDSYGHITGDKVLQKLAEIFESSVRETDLVYRYGGEEFVIVCPHTDCDSAINLAERLRRKIRRYRFVPEDTSKTISVSVSIGVTQVDDNEDVETLIKRADEALYSSKISGKDQTTKYCV
ncbi:diguanylate cyclase/phosphodiesterase (GGDEF & EAL domains) with PAS/PAC sensor(s) [Dissulfuribacter thermophilus]|uniref:diguanylate cyclase n=2 Tax=Dissulfuribacter thermophilus TaxID=1156395 RepID=A0A1B9F5U6_9BACT|nr:diguanylate cyclase/phosphodiesterase (GGDEF & EAL domains) with PAS/PAC sensor(s) [Dissulfuribacter thermophilus]